MKSHHLVFILAMFLVWFASLAAHSQGAKTATVTLQVVDPVGNPIPHSRLRVVPRRWDPTSPRPETDKDGLVRLDIAPGAYEVFADAPNFNRARQKFEVTDTAAQAVRITLQVGSYSGPEVTAAISAEEEPIWKLENNLWKAAEQNDRAAYKALWRADCVSWHDHAFVWSGPDNAASWMFDKNGRHLEEFMLHPEAVKMLGNTAMTFFTATALWVDDDGRGEPKYIRYTHYWVKAGNTWQLVGEMVAEEK